MIFCSIIDVIYVQSSRNCIVSACHIMLLFHHVDLIAQLVGGLVVNGLNAARAILEGNP